MILFLVAYIFTSGFAMAEELPWQLRLATGLDYMAKPGVNPNHYQWQPEAGVDVGLEFSGWAVLMDWRYVATSSSEGNFSLRTEEHQILLWGRGNFYDSEKWSFWGQVGAGQKWARITAKTSGGSDSQNADGQLVSGVGLGMTCEWLPRWYIDIAGKALKSELDTHWEMGIAIGLGLRL